MRLPTASYVHCVLPPEGEVTLASRPAASYAYVVTCPARFSVVNRFPTPSYVCWYDSKGTPAGVRCTMLVTRSSASYAYVVLPAPARPRPVRRPPASYENVNVPAKGARISMRRFAASYVYVTRLPSGYVRPTRFPTAAYAYETDREILAARPGAAGYVRVSIRRRPRASYRKVASSSVPRDERSAITRRFPAAS